MQNCIFKSLSSFWTNLHIIKKKKKKVVTNLHMKDESNKKNKEKMVDRM